MKHTWSHRAFKKDLEESITWMKNFADLAGLDYNELLDGLKQCSWGDDILCDGGKYESARGYFTPELWDHYSIISGYNVYTRNNPFSCSC